MINGNNLGLLHELKRLMADGWGRILDAEEESRGRWFRFPSQAKPANDESFTPSVKAEQTRVKKSANTPNPIAVFRGWCQNVLTGKNGTMARRYWDFVPFAPVGPGVKTGTPPQKPSSDIRQSSNIQRWAYIQFFL
jgi:hypothetical protein